MDGVNTTVRLNVASAVLQRLITFEFRLKPGIRDLLDICVGVAEGCDLLILLLRAQINRSQPSAAPTLGSRTSSSV
jgi:hypothetical protein